MEDAVKLLDVVVQIDVQKKATNVHSLPQRFFYLYVNILKASL